MLTSGPPHGHSRELYNVFWLLRTRAGLCCARRPFLGVYLSILGGVWQHTWHYTPLQLLWQPFTAGNTPHSL